MTEPRITLPADSESVAATRRRERLFLRAAGVFVLLAGVSFVLWWLLESWQLLSLLLAIAGTAFAGLGVFALLPILWRRVCSWRGHAFRETDVFPDGSATVYECRHCGEHRYVTREATQNA